MNWKKYGLKTKPRKKSYNWWWLLGYLQHSREKEPKYPKIKPYLDGWWDKEEENRDRWGNSNFL